MIVVIGILGVLAALAVAFVVMAQLERRASEQRVNAARAYLLARSGIEDALARLDAGQDPDYGGEDWDNSGALDGLEPSAEVFRPGILDVDACPVRHALRPSFFARDAASLGADGKPAPLRQLVDGRERGYSGTLSGDLASLGNTYALQARSANAGIHVNGGDPASPDLSMEGPNGFLVRLLDNLEAVVTGGSGLGAAVVAARPAGGYASLDQLPAPARPFRPYLTLQAWVDPKVLKPQPMDERPQRWQDIDESHRSGREASEISGVRLLEAGAAPQGNVFLNPGVLGGEQGPWTQTITAINGFELTKVYPVTWERGYVYAWSQLRPAPPVREPRAPLSIHSAPAESLAAAFLGLLGAHLEVWDGSAGWDDGFGWWHGAFGYPYPSQGFEETPWIRTRVDYGMTYGTPARPWYGPRDYDPHAPPGQGVPFPVALGGKPVVLAAPLGRLKETAPLTLPQARGIAATLVPAKPLGTWERFNAAVDALPRWEDLDNDGVLDGSPYPVVGAAGVYTRRMYKREDLDSDGVMTCQAFPGGTKGLTFLQKDVIKAMANPNADLNDFNPDTNLFKEVDKLDLLDHTTELSLDDLAGPVAVASLGRVLGPGGRCLARRRVGAVIRTLEIHRDTTQADFLGTVSGPEAPYAFSGGRPLLGHPEPPSLPPADYDGQVGLGLIAPAAAGETIRGALFGTADAADTGDAAAPDLRGPFLLPLLKAVDEDTGNVFADGVYSEKDRSLMYPMEGNLTGTSDFTIACWVKPHWLPEASPRAHALVSLSPAMAPTGMGATFTVPVVGNAQRPDRNPFGVPFFYVPVDDIRVRPFGLYFIPHRNSLLQDRGGVYNHGWSQGNNWPSRSLIWGIPHSFAASEGLNRRGIEAPLAAHPLGRLEGRRWQHLAVSSLPGLRMGRAKAEDLPWHQGLALMPRGTKGRHVDGTPNHLRFGEIAAAHNMNYVADATFANVRVRGAADGAQATAALADAAKAGILGRYGKEPWAALDVPLPAGLRPARITWTEVPCAAWFDETPLPDGWLERRADDRDGDGKRDVRIALEVWNGPVRIARFEDAAAGNRLPAPSGTLRYRAVFVNDWDPATRFNHPLDATPFLDDVTVLYMREGGPRVTFWESDEG